MRVMIAWYMARVSEPILWFIASYPTILLVCESERLTFGLNRSVWRDINGTSM